ncbi:MAG: hypothetical protein RLY31_2124 [Bacteroidota bacterium]|jgi:uncharacterized damage-inducible protein DinB
MLIQDVRHMLNRDLLAMAEELTAIPDEHLWRPLPGVINPVGTLSLHICGNLRHFIGALLGGDGYVRDREEEFHARNLPKEELLRRIEETRSAVSAALETLPQHRLQDPMPAPPPQHEGRSIAFFLVQLCCHTSRHQGQLNYLRRILAG